MRLVLTTAITKLSVSVVFGSGDVEVPISARGHLRESWLMHRHSLADSIGEMSALMPTKFWRNHLHNWMGVEGRQIHADYVHDFL